MHQVEHRPPDEVFGGVAQDRGYRGACVSDRAFAVEHRDDVHRLLDQRPEVLLPLAQLPLHALRRAMTLESTLYCGSQAGDSALEHVVHRARLHVLHGGLLIERARQKNEWHIRRVLPYKVQCRDAAELRQPMVGNDDVGMELTQGLLEVWTYDRASHDAIEPGPSQLDLDELSIRVVVFEQEDADRHRAKLTRG